MIFVKSVAKIQMNCHWFLIVALNGIIHLKNL